MQTVIVGMGEVGKALGEMFKDSHHYDSSWDFDIYSMAADIYRNGDPVALHIAFPFNRTFTEPAKDFCTQVRRYENLFKPSYTIIHSTVPIGTSKQLGVYHSPVRGVHPYIAESMRTFETYLAPNDSQVLFKHFWDAGFKMNGVEDSDNTEAGKLWSLAAYAVSITLEKQIHVHCEKNGLDFDLVYKDFTETYNAGYNSMGHPEYTRPVLKHIEGPIGGHCVISGTKMLNEGGLLWGVLTQDKVRDSESVRV